MSAIYEIKFSEIKQRFHSAEKSVGWLNAIHSNTWSNCIVQ